MAMDLVSLKAANPYSSKERCYKLQYLRLTVDQRKRPVSKPFYSIYGCRAGHIFTSLLELDNWLFTASRASDKERRNHDYYYKGDGQSPLSLDLQPRNRAEPTTPKTGISRPK